MFEFDESKSLGSLPAPDIANHLMDIGDADEAGFFMDGGVDGQGLSFYNPPYKSKGMVVGFLGAGGQIEAASQVDPDHSLIGKQIRVTLDRLYVESYPGHGDHTIVCEFNGRNQVQNDTEALKFATKLVAGDKAAPAWMSMPVFVGLTVSGEGLAFEGRTINVASGGSEAILEALESPTFKAGLTLINTAQPALKPFISIASAAIKTIESNTKNKQVHSFNLGLDFSERVSSTSLRQGTYIVVQADDLTWDWSNFEWNSTVSLLTDRRKPVRDGVGFNYLVIGVSLMSNPAVSPVLKA